MAKRKIDYKLLISEKEFLKVKLRASRLHGNRVVEVRYRDKEVLFKTESGTTPGIYWYQRVQIMDLENLKINRNTKNLDKVIRDSGLKVHCNCLTSDAEVTVISWNNSVTEKTIRIDQVIPFEHSVLTSQGFRQVWGYHWRIAFRFFQIKLQDGKEVTCTRGHLLKTIDGFTKAKNLRVGDHIQVSGGAYVPIISIHKFLGCKIVMDLSMFDGPHDYYSNGILSHNCPAFLYYGFKWIAWHRGYGLEKETRRPTVRNPHLRGHVCSTGETLVLTDNGYVEIKDINEGDLVYTHRGRLRKVLHKYELESDDVYRVRWSIKKHFNVTGEHKFYAFKPKTQKTTVSAQKDLKFTPITVSAINEGDYLMRRMLDLPEEITVENSLAFMCGLFLADGSMHYYSCKGESSKVHYKDNVYLNCIEIAFAWDRLKFYKKVLSSEGIPYETPVKTKNRENDGQMFVRDNRFIEFVYKTCNFTSKKYNEDKVASKDILRWNKDAKKHFLRGFFCGDGTTSNTGMNFTNTNKSIISILLQLLMENYEVSYYIKNAKHEKYKPCYVLQICGDYAEELRREYSDIMRLKGVKSFNRTVISKRQEIGRCRAAFVKEKSKLDGSHKVYTLEVEEDHSYLTESGIAQENCKHLYQAMQVYPFISNKLAQRIKNQAEKENKKLERSDKLNRSDE